MLAERLLLACSFEPAPPAVGCDNGLCLLLSVFPDFLHRIRGKVVADFGCGDGYQAHAMSHCGAAKVVGFETNPATLARCSALSTHAEFTSSTERRQGQFDIVVSQNSMEHFTDPALALTEMTRLLKPGGSLIMTFGPPWYAPYGSHMQFFTSIPWLQLFFSERTVMKVRARFRSDGAKHYEEVESGLNKMSIRKFERLTAHLRPIYRHYQCIKGWNWLAKIPILRELFINRVDTIFTV